MQEKIVPLRDIVLIKEVIIEEKKTNGGIIIPEIVKSGGPVIGIVLDVGKDEGLNKEIKIGDKIIYSKANTNEVTIENEKYTFIKFEDIISILEV